MCGSGYDSFNQFIFGIGQGNFFDKWEINRNCSAMPQLRFSGNVAPLGAYQLAGNGETKPAPGVDIGFAPVKTVKYEG